MITRTQNSSIDLVDTFIHDTHVFISTNYRVCSMLWICIFNFVKLRQGSGKEGQGMALKAKGLKA